MMVIAIAMKLTVDMSASMPSNLDQMAKIGSIAFMCTILAILNPSLASMSNKTLRSNIIGLAIFVITIAVNLFIEIHTGVITNQGPEHHISTDNGEWKVVKIGYSSEYVLLAYVYIGIMLFLLLISISTAIIVPSIKKILEFKYQQARRRKALNDQHRITKVEDLTQHVTRYWVMAQSGSPQFNMACNLLSYTSLVLCVAGMIAYIHVLSTLHKTNAYDGNFESDYLWSLSLILWIQFLGSVIGTVILISRCYTSMKFKVHDILRTKYRFKIFIVRKEKYWTLRLCEWQGSHRHIGFLSSHPRLRAFIHHIKKVALSLCIGLQFAFVQFNQLLATPFIYILSYIIEFEDASGCRFFTAPVVSKIDDNYDDLRSYVLQLEDDDVVQPSQRVVEIISESMNHLIQRAKKKQNSNLLELLGKSKGFKGVENFDDNIDQDVDFNHLNLNSWSVPVVSLSCIAIAVPGISEDEVDSLIKSIDNALLYTRHVEKSFNSAREYVNICKTATTLWYEVRDKRKWLGNSIKKGGDILTSLAAKAEVILKEYKTNTIEEHMIDFPNKLIAAHSMHRISHSILSKYPDEIQTNKRFFELLCSMIADILVACFSNLPQVIKMKCHADEIEKREASVEAAVKLLGRTTEIIRKLEACELPSMDPEKMGSIDEWRLHLKQSSFP